MTCAGVIHFWACASEHATYICPCDMKTLHLSEWRGFDLMTDRMIITKLGGLRLRTAFDYSNGTRKIRLCTKLGANEKRTASCSQISLLHAISESEFAIYVTSVIRGVLLTVSINNTHDSPQIACRESLSAWVQYVSLQKQFGASF